MHLRPLLFIKVFLCVVMCLTPTLGIGDVVEDEQETWRRIRMVGSQRMLTQLIGRATCYVMSGLQTEQFAQEAAQSADLFERNMKALRTGNDAAGLRAELNESVLAVHSDTQFLWRVYGPASRQIMHGDFHSIPLRQVLASDAAILASTEAFTDRIETIYQEKLLARKRLAVTINVASRQSMYVMQMAKAHCYVTLGIHVDRMLKDMSLAVSEFDAALSAMEFGDYDRSVIDPPGLAALAQISDIRSVWEDLEPILETVLKQGQGRRADIPHVARHTTQLRDMTDAMVDIYLE